MNPESIIAEIDSRFSRDIEALTELRTKYALSCQYNEVERLGGKIEGYKEMRQKAIEAIRLAAAGDPQWMRDALTSQLIEAAGDMVATYPAGSEWSKEQLRLKAAWWECVR